MRIAFIGLGAIGREVLSCLAASGAGVSVLGALVARPERRVNAPCTVFAGIDELVAARPDLALECASQRALRDLGPRVLASGCDLLASSVGALADEALHEALRAAAVRGASRLLIPSGALVGIDALAAARHVGLASVRYTRRAPPATWIRSGAVSAEQAAAHDAAFEVFAGSAREAAIRFPKNANVAATIALAGIGFDDTEVVLIADPAASGNTHAIHASGEFGELHAEITARTIAASSSSKVVAGSLARGILAQALPIVV